MPLSYVEVVSLAKLYEQKLLPLKQGGRATCPKVGHIVTTETTT